MKRTQSISIANTLFHIEEDAYEMLDKYLRGIREHFKNVPEHDEIVSDIEARIAEQFIEKTGEPRIVVREHVEALMKSMGAPEELGGEEAEAAAKKSSEGPRRLYRDGDNMIIAGVASGIAAFFGIDPVIVRILFVLSLFAGGFGIVIYLVLWLIVPLAETTTEKLEMKGNAITLESVKNAVEEKIHKVKPPKGTLAKIIEFPIKIIGAVFAFIRTKLFPIIGTIVGILVFTLGAALFIGLTFLLIVGTFNAASYFDPAWSELLEGTLYHATLIAAYLSLVIPALFIVALGLILIRKKNTLSSRTGFALLGVWFAALIAAGVSGASFADRVQRFVETSPTFETMRELVELEAFEAIEAQNGARVTLIQSETRSITLEGTEREIERTSVAVEDGTLVIESDWRRDCIFCDHSPALVEIAVPNLRSISLENGSRLVSEDALAFPSLEVAARNASRIELEVESADLEIRAENFSFVTLSGTSSAIEASLSNSSRLDALDLASESASVTAENASRANIGETALLEAISRNASRIYYAGDPEMSENSSESDGSHIEPLSERTEEEWRWD